MTGLVIIVVVKKSEARNSIEVCAPTSPCISSPIRGLRPKKFQSLQTQIEMASSARPPRLLQHLRDCRYQRPHCLFRYQNASSFHDHHRRRLFSTSPRCAAPASKFNQLRAPTMRQPSQKSMKTNMEEAKKKMMVPDDMGLLPGTFVTPPWSRRPNIAAPMGRLKWEWLRLKTRFVEGIA